jgi:sec-independent protein translocase protein TatA
MNARRHPGLARREVGCTADCRRRSCAQLTSHADRITGPIEIMLYPAVLGMPEWIPILIVVLLLFGAKKLPELARSMGSSVNEFKKGMSEGAKSDDKSADSSASASAKDKKEG